MKTDADRLRWAVRFSETNLMPLGEPALARLRRELEAFLGGDAKGFAVLVAVTRPPQPWDYSARELHALRRSARELLRGAAVGDGTAGATAIEAVVADVVHDRAGRRTLRIGGSVRAGFLFSLAVLLATKEGARVMQCPECRRIFVRVRRQLYCSRKCVNRATWRGYTEAQKRRWREKQYAKQGWTLGARKKGAMR